MTFCKFAAEIDMNTNSALAFVIVGFLAVGQVFADKPPWAGGGKGAKKEYKEAPHDDNDDHGERQQRDDDQSSSRDRVKSKARSQVHFRDQHRKTTHDYYKKQFGRGNCPPGLAKKDNGCMPPGQAKKWPIGRVLPREVTYYEVPSALVLRFGPPPPGYHYVRVENEILLIAIATGMIVDAIRDLGRK